MSAPVLFISDLHLHASAPEITTQLLNFLRGDARQAETLYILGDLFEAWIGDDDPDPHYAHVQDALAEFAQHVPWFFMRGNRDFMIGDQFAARTGCTLLDDPVVHVIHGESVLLSHGDQYCTDDVEYQAVRKTVRDPAWQQQVMSLPVAARLKMASDARAQSASSNQQKADDIMDVNAAAIIDALQAHNVTTLLHGHTHRPNIHEMTLADGTTARRIVLGDWYTQGSVGRWDETGFRLSELPR